MVEKIRNNGRHLSRRPDLRVPSTTDVLGVRADKQTPLWLQQISALPRRRRTTKEGAIIITINAISVRPGLRRISKGLREQKARAFMVFERAASRRVLTGDYGPFAMQIRNSSPDIPSLVMIQDGDRNPRTSVRAFFLETDGAFALRAMSGGDTRDVRTILENFRREEGYQIDRALSASSAGTTRQ